MVTATFGCPALHSPSFTARSLPGRVCRARRTFVRAAGQGEVPVTFIVEKEAERGEHVRVVGGPKVLGEWDAGRAPALCLSEGSTRLWSGTVEGLRVGALFEFKFAVVQDSDRLPADSRAADWESIPNRKFQPGGAQTIKAVWDKPGFEAGPAAPGSGGSPRGWEGAQHGFGPDAEVKARLDATVKKLAEQACS